MSIAIQKQSSLPEMPQESEIDKEQLEKNIPNTEDVLLNHEHRIQMIEAALMRIRGAI